MQLHVCRLKRRCQVAARITPGRVRHLMVTFANNNPAVFGGREYVVASTMGHHVRMWREVYDKAVNVRSVALAAEAVAAVREAVVAELEARRLVEAAEGMLAAVIGDGAGGCESEQSEYESAVAELEAGGEEVTGHLSPVAEAADEEAAAAEMDVSEDDDIEVLFTSDDEDDIVLCDEDA